MKYLPLIWAALTRRKLRTVLTLLSVTAAFTLFGVVMGTDAAFQRMVDVINRSVVVIGARFGGNHLTDAVGRQIAAMPNVAAVSATGGICGYHRDPKNRFCAMMLENAQGWPNAPMNTVQWAQLQARPDGMFISREIAAKQGLKKGDIFNIVIAALPRADGGQAWRFEVLDVLEDTPYWVGGFSFGSYHYYKISRSIADQPKVGWFQAVVKDPAAAEKTAIAIDARFANSATPTEAISERTMRTDDGTAIVNVARVTRRVAAVGLFMILLLTAHGMAQSVRERLGEFAVLKTMGYSDSGVIALLFAEALVPVIGGAALGLGLAALMAERIPKLLPTLYLPEPYLSPAVMAQALFAALVLAFLSVILPALRLKRLDVAAILSGRT